MHQSIATIDSPEFLNLQPLDINPLMSKCEIKVLYVGGNRNHTFITEQVAAEIGKTLRGAPIVGYYKDSKEDFADHGEKIIIDDEGVKFQCQTIPYGFVSPDAQVWFQNFEDEDDSGNKVIHKYLMTTGYLWTDQFPESSLPVEQGRPQSMEFKKESVKGQWQTNYNNGIDFFIINDAIIRKLCILGDDVEPCFEGSSVTAPDISEKFTLDNGFKIFYTMMQDLKNTLNGGDNDMMKVLDEQETNAIVTPAVEYTTVIVDNSNLQEPSAPTSDYVKKDDEEDKDKENNSSESSNDNGSEKENSSSNNDNKEEDDKDDDEKKKDNKYTLLENELNTLKEEYSNLQTQYQELIKFKTEIDNEKKDALIAEFYMLSDEDKKEIIDNKEKYSLEDIKAKLAVICFDKKINFTLNKEAEEQQDNSITTYTLNDNENSNLPDWVKAVKEQEKLS